MDKVFKNPLSQEEENRANVLIAAKLKNEKQHELITKELRQLIYKIEKSRL